MSGLPWSAVGHSADAVPMVAFQAQGADPSGTVPAEHAAGGMPVPAPWATELRHGRRGHKCSSPTKSGADCKSKAIQGTDLCVGHWRVAIAYAEAVAAEEAEAEVGEAQAEAEAPAEGVLPDESGIDDAGEA